MRKNPAVLVKCKRARRPYHCWYHSEAYSHIVPDAVGTPPRRRRGLKPDGVGARPDGVKETPDGVGDAFSTSSEVADEVVENPCSGLQKAPSALSSAQRALRAPK